MARPPPRPTLFPYTTLFRSRERRSSFRRPEAETRICCCSAPGAIVPAVIRAPNFGRKRAVCLSRSEEHTSELQSHVNLVCRLLLEKKKIATRITVSSSYRRG